MRHIWNTLTLLMLALVVMVVIEVVSKPASSFAGKMTLFLNECDSGQLEGPLDLNYCFLKVEDGEALLVNSLQITTVVEGSFDFQFDESWSDNSEIGVYTGSAVLRFDQTGVWWAKVSIDELQTCLASLGFYNQSGGQSRADACTASS